MAKRLKSGGGWQAVKYTFRKAREAGGLWKFWKAMRSRNACKTCALGMGGQKGGMVNEVGGFPEVCKKSLQAMAADMQAPIPDSFWSTYSVAQLKKFSPREMETRGRLATPLVLENGEQYYRPISWSDAIERITKKLKMLSANETFWYFSGRSSNEAGFLLQLFARLYGTNNVNNCSFYCHQASGVGLQSSIGSGTATIQLEDLEKADLVFLIGGNPASNHPRLMTTLMKIRRRGGKVIVINPVVETGLVNFKIPSDVRSMLFGSKIASLYVQPDIGGDLALITGIAKRIVELGKHDPRFLQEYCDGSEEWLANLASVTWEEIEKKSGVAKSEIDQIAEAYAEAEKTVFSWTMGITHHAHGVENVQAIANLALLRGMIGKENAGLMPIRGHSNVQGIGSVGVTPKLKDAIFDKLQNELDVSLPTVAGLDTLACMDGANSGTLKFGLCLGGNLYGSNPDSVYADQSLSNLEMLVQLNTTLNTGHAMGLAKETIILPVLARDEESQPTTQESMFNLVRLSDGGQQRFEGARSEVDVVCDLGEEVLSDSTPIDWTGMRTHDNIRDWISKVIPGWTSIGEIAKTKREFQIAGRTLHEPRFAMESGRAKIHIHKLPDLKGHGEWLRLMTVRSEGQFNTVVYEEEDIYRGQDRRDVILMNPRDVARLKLSHDQAVTIESKTGRLENIRIREFPEIKAGNVLMYYPEANVLVSRSVDPKSKTPAFKGELVRVLVDE